MSASRLRALPVALPLFLATLTVAAPAYAIPVTFDFTARINEVINVPGVAVGDLVSGSVSFETDTPPTYGSSTYVYAFYNPVGQMSFSVGPVSSVSSEVWMILYDDFNFVESSVVEDRFEVLTDLSGTGWEFRVGAPGGNLMTSTAIPLQPPNLALAQWTNFVAHPSTGSSLGGTIESLTLAAPEPAPPLLIALVLGSVAFARRATAESSL